MIKYNNITKVNFRQHVKMYLSLLNLHCYSRIYALFHFIIHLYSKKMYFQ